MSENRPVLDPRALTTVERVKALIPSFTATDVDDDDLLIELINEQSREIYRDSGREFIAAGAGGEQARSFDVDDTVFRSQTLPVGDMTSVDGARVLDSDGGLVVTLAAPSWVELPRRRDVSVDPIVRLWFRPDVITTAALAVGQVVEVTGVYGFPALPADVEFACRALVVNGYIRDLAAFSDSGDDAVSNPGGLRRLVRKALDTIDYYKRQQTPRLVSIDLTSS